VPSPAKPPYRELAHNLQLGTVLVRKFLPSGGPSFSSAVRKLRTVVGFTVCGKGTFCHPERSEGSAFLLGFQETADSSGKPRPSEWHDASFSAADL